MCTGSAQAQLLFPGPCIDAVVTLTDQYPSVPFERPRRKLYVLRNAYDAFQQPFRVLYTLPPANPHPCRSHLLRQPRARDKCEPAIQWPAPATAQPLNRTPGAHQPTYWGLGGIRKRRLASFSSSFPPPLFSSTRLDSTLCASHPRDRSWYLAPRGLWPTTTKYPEFRVAALLKFHRRHRQPFYPVMKASVRRGKTFEMKGMLWNAVIAEMLSIPDALLQSCSSQDLSCPRNWQAHNFWRMRTEIRRGFFARNFEKY